VAAAGLPAGHRAHFVRDMVRSGLDLSAIVASYDEERGDPPYHNLNKLATARQQLENTCA
jgi:hypothetical protein